jgi:hypothetical protein
MDAGDREPNGVTPGGGRRPQALGSLPDVTDWPTLRTLDYRVGVLRKLAQQALRAGDWERAAHFEEQAILTEHRAGLLRQGLMFIFEAN